MPHSPPSPISSIARGFWERHWHASHEPRDPHSSLCRSLAEVLCGNISHSPSHGAQEKALVPSRGREPPPPTSPRCQHPRPPRGLLSGATEAPGWPGCTRQGSCPWKGSHRPGKEEQRPPGTRRSPAPLPSLPSDCGCAGAADGGCTRPGRREYKASARAFRSCRSQIIPLSPVDANTAVMAVVSLFPVLPAGVPTSLPGRGAPVSLF